MASSAMKGMAWIRKEYEALCKAYRWVSEDSVRGNCQTNDGVWTHPPHRAPTVVFGTASSAADMDENGSPTIQQTRVENPSSGEGSIPRAMGRNKVQRLKEKGKANDNYAAQHEVAASLRLMPEQNALEAEERKSRHEERVKQIQEEMDDKNMEMNTSNYTPMSKTYFDRKKKEIMNRR
ncbi:hypothetical protein D8674_015297 [Pyrus ussuriensis x Pyrus communis]|uniref:No apical meristem-associated C-terminal domain-containing protein n=1 Tax=Pyrus ussuriensis x Pyrus communis TaxID=2448454 RepID=A0A5N5GVW3_9ROSA|nr:hypothetical protein D8674_015297 [Pyrus ussuriensis x Pyrus communis]